MQPVFDLKVKLKFSLLLECIFSVQCTEVNSWSWCFNFYMSLFTAQYLNCYSVMNVNNFETSRLHLYVIEGPDTVCGLHGWERVVEREATAMSVKLFLVTSYCFFFFLTGAGRTLMVLWTSGLGHKIATEGPGPITAITTFSSAFHIICLAPPSFPRFLCPPSCLSPPITLLCWQLEVG